MTIYRRDFVSWCERCFLLSAAKRKIDIFLAIMDILENNIGEFCESSYFLLLDPAIREHGLGVLTAFVKECRLKGAGSPETFTQEIVETVLFTRLGMFDLPLQTRKGIPSLLSAFFKYLAESGRFPPAATWQHWVNAMQDRYIGRFRDNGTIKGETYKKNYTDVNRNDPCPCGSGKKFKKCCMKLIGS
jgi:hypothetical protein